MPGTQIRERQALVPRSQPIRTGTAFYAGVFDKGPVGKPILCRNMTDVERYYGKKQTYSTAWDELNWFFRLGGTLVYISRVVGPAAVTASLTLNAAGSSSLIATATGPGAWANLYNLAVEAGDAAGEFKLRLTHDTDATINELTPSFVDQAAAIAWAAQHDVYRLSLGVSAADPDVVAAVSFAAGADDRVNISDATAKAALDAIPKSLGPGQVVYGGRFTAVAHQQLTDHAKANARVALANTTDTTSKTTLLAAATAFRALLNGRYGALFGPWVDVPSGIPGVANIAMPPAMLVAGIIARNESQGYSANDPAAGDLGILPEIVGVRATFNEADQNELNEASVNLIIDKGGDIKVYGWRAGTSKVTNPNWWQFGQVRLYMTIAALADRILERYVLKKIDGQKILFGKLEGELTDMLIPFRDNGDLFVDTNNPNGFYVDTSDNVNTRDTISNGEIHAVIELVMSSMGENVILDIVKRQITG